MGLVGAAVTEIQFIDFTVKINNRYSGSNNTAPRRKPCIGTNVELWDGGLLENLSQVLIEPRTHQNRHILISVNGVILINRYFGNLSRLYNHYNLYN